MTRIAPILATFLTLAATSRAHDIPNARVDRSIQAIVRPGRLEIDYEVGLSELTLTKDLRALIGVLPGADRADWFDRYGRETGPLNARGFLVAIDGDSLKLRSRGFDLAVEEHPRYTFHYECDLPARGRLTVHDTNFMESEGTSRLAIRGQGGVEVRGDSLPTDVNLIPVRPVWQLSDSEERRTKQVEVDFRAPEITGQSRKLSPASTLPHTGGIRKDQGRLTDLLDRVSRISVLGLGLIAFSLGAAHAVQPGHGKTLVAATVVGDRGGAWRGAVLAVVITLTHTGSVLLVVAGLWLTRSDRYGAIHGALARGAGFAIAAIGLWRLGRHLAGFGEEDHGEVDPSRRGLIGLGVAGGLVPCWDAIGLIVLAEAIGRLALGVALLVAFGSGMAAVLVAVGWLAARLRRNFVRIADGVDWEYRLGIASGLVLTGIGIYLMG